MPGVWKGRWTSVLCVAWIGVLSGCEEASPPPTDLTALVATLTDEAWNQGDVEVFSSMVADTVVFHYAGSSREMTSDELAAGILGWRDAFPDLEMVIEESIQEGDLVASRMSLSGTHEGPWRGIPPTGRAASMALMMFFRFDDGRLVELWEVDDQLGFREQLGLIP